MGCFDVGCFLSRMSIHYKDDCLLLPVIANDDRAVFYPTAHWKPFCLPIRGKYDDYGRIEKIVEDKNTAAIEKYFGMSITQFVGIVTSYRPEMYGGSSIVQEAYGVRDVVLTRESLARIGFVTHDDQTVTHGAFDVLTENGQKVDMYWSDGEFHVKKPDWTKSVSYEEGGSNYECSRLLNHLTEVHTSERKKLPFHVPFARGPVYCFGVPVEKHGMVELLLSMKAAFAHYGVYHALGDKAWKMSEKNRNPCGSSEEELDVEYVRLVTSYLEMKTRNDEWMAVPPEERRSRPDYEKMAMEDFRFSMSREREELWQTILEPFKSGENLQGREFLAMYGTLLLDDDIREQLAGFRRLGIAMYMGNIYIMPHRSHQQFGDVGEQCALAQTILTEMRKVGKSRDTH